MVNLGPQIFDVNFLMQFKMLPHKYVRCYNSCVNQTSTTQYLQMKICTTWLPAAVVLWHLITSLIKTTNTQINKKTFFEMH
jgi:hypothetical protein